MSGPNEDRSLIHSFKSLLIFQLLIGYIFVISGLIVNVFQLLAACFIWPFNRALYRKINYYLATIIWSQITFIYQWWSNSDAIFYIKPEDLEKMRQENSVWLGNHRTEIDWLLGWVFTQRLGLAGVRNFSHGSKVLGKRSLRALPIVGWCWYFTESIFLRRAWNTDKAVLERDMKRLVDNYPKNYNFTLILACEGTRYSNEKRLESMEVAREKGLPELKHHILPRTKGFVLLMQGIHDHISAVYDITAACQIPGNPDIFNLLAGQRAVVEAYVRRIPISDVPYDDEKQCAQFIHKVFQEKDKIYEYFVQHGTFNGAGNPRSTNFNRKSQDLIIEIFLFIIIGFPSIYLFYKFLLYASFFSQTIFFLIILAGIFGVHLMMKAGSRAKQQ